METKLADPAITGRTCGTCTLCCKVMEIHELGKPVGKWCPNCKVGVGCLIYGSHPPSCQSFVCQWLGNPELPDAFRPDKVRVVITAEATAEGMRLVANCDPSNPMAWRKEPMYGWLKVQADQSWRAGGSVVAKAYNRLWLIGPSGDLDLGNVDQRSPVLMEQRADGTYHAEVLPPVSADENLATAVDAMRDRLPK